MRDGLVDIAGTPYWAIRGDEAITPVCQRLKRLDWDREYFLGIPEVSILSRGSVVADVGAFIGDTTKIFLDLDCEVHSFECQDDAVECLRHNCPSAKIYEQAVGDGQSYLVFSGPTGNYGARFIVPNWNGPKAIRLDDLPFRRLDLLKIDVEGYEPFVLDGAKATITRLRPTIHIEVNWRGYMRHNFKESDLLGRLDALGYKWREVRRDDEFQWDALAVPR